MEIKGHEKYPTNDLLINKSDGDPEGVGHVLESEASVGLEELVVGYDPHLPDIVSVVGVQVPVVLHQLLYLSCDIYINMLQ